jgi:hypothetical protein
MGAGKGFASAVAGLFAAAGGRRGGSADARLCGAGSAGCGFTIRVNQTGSIFKCAAEATVAPPSKSAAVTVSQKVQRCDRVARMRAATRVS